MAGDHRESMVIDRRTSTRISTTEQEDDDYDLEAMGISDGFRPSAATTSHNRGPQTSPHNTPGRRTPPPRPSSTTKPKVDSFALRHDGGMGHIARNSSIAASHASSGGPTRSSSTSTNAAAYVRAETPYQGPSGPSHPYQMYPQESRLARTMSVATTSTIAVPDRPYNGPGGPTHPYGMYPQNIVPEGEATGEVAPIPPPVPVGFPGLNSNYQRRLGPDGEEIADIIGPDGHTEQLPPYTKYPEEALARKTRPTITVPLEGAGGIGLATRNPEFESREDLNTPQSRQSTRSISSDSDHQINTAAAAMSEKPALNKWQLIAKKKVCGVVPLWAIGLAAAVFVLFGIILGTVLAILKPKHPPKHYRPDGDDGPPESIIMTTMTTTFDATPLATAPTNLPALPTGTFVLPITAPFSIQNSCILNTAMSAAWSCSIGPSDYSIEIEEIPSASSNLNNNEINLTLGNNTFPNYYPYGAQPPVLTQQQVLNLVSDSQDLGKGPAWFFEIPYNKLVILREEMLTSPNGKRNFENHRGYGYHGSHGDDNDRYGDHWADTTPDFMSRRGVAQTGEKPWFCYWNGTLLEAFIYVNVTSGAVQTPTSSASATTTSNGNYGSSKTYAAAATTASQASGSSSSLQDVWPMPYPKVIKIEERRIPQGAQAISPYCVQHRIEPDGTAEPILNSTNHPITIYLNESDPSAISEMTGKRSLDALLARNLEIRQNPYSCGCVWLWN